MKRLVLYLLIFIFAASLAYAMPGSWYGYVTLNGSTASDDAVVDAYISGSIAGTALVGAVQSNGYYLIHVEGNVGDNVSFKIYGNNVTQAAQAWATDLQPILNLTATSTANTLACPTYSGYSLPTTYNANPGCTGEYCVHSYCRASTTYCGDGYCDTGETCSSCSGDCGSCSPGGGGGGGGGGGTTTLPSTPEELPVEEEEPPSEELPVEEEKPVQPVEEEKLPSEEIPPTTSIEEAKPPALQIVPLEIGIIILAIAIIIIIVLVLRQHLMWWKRE